LHVNGNSEEDSEGSREDTKVQIFLAQEADSTLGDFSSNELDLVKNFLGGFGAFSGFSIKRLGLWVTVVFLQDFLDGSNIVHVDSSNEDCVDDTPENTEECCSKNEVVCNRDTEVRGVLECRV